MTRSAGAPEILVRRNPDAKSRFLHNHDAETFESDVYALIAWDDLLPWQRDNEHILTGHRKASFAYSTSVKSIWRIHNETVNIWSHVLGATAFLTATLILCYGNYAKGISTLRGDELAISTYFVSVVTCFLFSFIFHIFLDHSEHICRVTSRFDYLGIVIPLWGTTVSSTYFGFHCEPTLQDLYRAMATIAGVLCAFTTLHPAFSGPTGRRFRVSMYCMLGLFSFLPIVHGVMLHGFSEHNRRMSLMYYLGLGACHSTGAALYAARVPERLYPRKFDIVGSSHQLMHVFVVLGAACYGIGILKAYDFWQDSTQARCGF